MKIYLLLCTYLFSGVALFSQNLQLHYDFGKDRKYFTATLEMYKADSFGSTFWFVDFDFNSANTPRGISMAYWEISHDFYIPGIKKIKGFEELGLHIEYNDGVQAEKINDSVSIGYNLTSTWLAGLSYPVRIGKVVVGTMLLYRYPRGATSADFQFTTIWYQPFCKGRLVLTGFIDIWSQDKLYETGKELVFQTEPQFWVALKRHIFIGNETEISKNFPFGPNDWKISPTLAFKWEF